MNKITTSLFSLLFLLFGFNTYAQESPVKFTYNIEKINDTTAQLKIDADIASGVHLYSTKKNTEDDIVSLIELEESISAHRASGDSIQEVGNLQTVEDATLGMTVRYYTDKASFIIPLRNIAEAVTVKGKFTWLAKQGEEFPSGEEEIVVVYDPVATAVAGDAANTTLSAATPPATSTIPAAGSSFWKLLGIGFLVGLAMVFTPCVFPLIPVTVSFFLKKSSSKAEGVRNAIVYSLSIIAIYTIPTLIITKLFGDKILYEVSTSAVANIIFFLIFLIFAISFFGAFELTLPSKWANKTDDKARKGGLMGIFFMALTLVIVSFSCTGPFVGTMLAEASSAGSWSTVAGIFGISAGLALPFTLFALFPSMLSSLPKSGGWLNTVKVVFGFIELALALKFLSMVDLQYHWGILDREVFLAIWIVLAVLMGLYLLGKLKFSHDSDLKYISVPRLFFAIASFSFALYMLPGMWGAPLKFWSGIFPPASTQDFDLHQLQYKIGANTHVGNTTTLSSGTGQAEPPKLYTDKLHVPFGLTAYFDLDEGMAAAKALNKPVMLDFTGWSCANCRKMENEVWSDEEVLKRLRNDFVLISLYVDEKTSLPPNQVYTATDGRKITNVGDKNLDYEITRFGFNAQPLYMFLDTEGKELSDIKYGYDPDIQKFINHLDAVKAAFEKRGS